MRGVLERDRRRVRITKQAAYDRWAKYDRRDEGDRGALCVLRRLAMR